MAKGAGIVALIFGIVAITPVNTLLVVVIPFWAVMWWLIPLLSVVLGIVGVATAKGDSKAPGILGIVFGAIGFGILWVWLLVLALIGLGAGMGSGFGLIIP